MSRDTVLYTFAAKLHGAGLSFVCTAAAEELLYLSARDIRVHVARDLRTTSMELIVQKCVIYYIIHVYKQKYFILCIS